MAKKFSDPMTDPKIVPDGNHPADADRPEGVSIQGWRDAYDESQSH